MTVTSTTDAYRARAGFETCKRLLFQMVNEQLANVRLENSGDKQRRWLVLTDPSQPADGRKDETTATVRVGLRPNAVPCVHETDGTRVTALAYPGDMVPPVTVLRGPINARKADEIYSPGALFTLMHPWFGVFESGDGTEAQIWHRHQMLDRLRTLSKDLDNGAANQAEWLRLGHDEGLSLDSPSIHWERTLLWGHPSHPLHRTLSAKSPLEPVQPENLLSMRFPELVFVRVPRKDMRISGPFESTLAPLLGRLAIEPPNDTHLVVPALTQQLLSIRARFPSAEVVFRGLGAEAQASMRTVQLAPGLEFPYHLKLSLGCTITSAMRTITPWSAIGGPLVSELLVALLPTDLWLFSEVAAATGAQSNFDDAKHFSCILREDHEQRAIENNEALIIASALAQPSIDDPRSWAERVFGLDTVDKTRSWFREYTACLLRLVLTPLVKHGVCLEAHGQNIVCRISKASKRLTGFVVRDFGGIRLHMPTLRAQGFELDGIPPGSAIKTDDEHAGWSKAHHALFQNHLAMLVFALGLDTRGGWTIVREELDRVLLPTDKWPGDSSATAVRLRTFLLGDTMPHKSFLQMNLNGLYRDYIETPLPNILHRA